MLAALADRVVPILAFLLCITVVADIADRAGLFEVIAQWAARVSQGHIGRLWLLVVALATVCVAVLSLDTAAVLLTPVVIALARRVRASPALFAWTTVWLANTASLFLPVSNLTNLIAMSHLHTDTRGFVAVLWLPAVTAVVVTVVLLWVVFRRDLRTPTLVDGRQDERVSAPSKPLLVLTAVVSAALIPALAAGADVTYASAVAAVILVIGAVVWLPSILSVRMVPWLLIVGVAVLFGLVELAHTYGLLNWLIAGAGAGTSWLALLRLAGVGALSANVINNLPGYLALEPAAGSAVRTGALLIGVNAGPLVTPWASLATLLWAGRCRAGGVQVNWLTFGLRGLVLVLVTLVVCVTALWLVG